MRIGLLGPLAVRADGVPLVFSAAKQRVVLATLALHPRRVVSYDELASAVWGEAPPDGARVTLRNYIRRMRRSLGSDGGQIVTRDPGYLLDLADEDVDVREYTTLFDQGAQAYAAGSWGVAVGLLGRALGLWRGVPLADVPSGILHQRWDAHLEGLRLQAAEWRARARLELGEHELLVPELDRLAARFPLREQVHGLRMLALYRAGRQGEALAAYRQARQVLAAELGVAPGTELTRLHQQILAQDPALTAPAPAPASPVPVPVAPGPVPVPVAASPVPVPVAASPVPPGPVPPAAVLAALAGPVPRQLPAAVPGFAGRAAELRLLARLAGQAATGTGTGTGPPILISAIAGTAGVGKTALAVHWAHQVAGQFPDGQLFVNLRGFDPAGTPADPAETIHTILEALGIDPARIPAGLDARAGLYRTLLAGRRMLIVLDNARDAAQIRPLIPGTGGILILTTSRDHLTGLSATHGAHLIWLSAPESRTSGSSLTHASGKAWMWPGPAVP
jgi:DNA-binding SARP family transcriptional activator